MRHTPMVGNPHCQRRTAVRPVRSSGRRRGFSLIEALVSMTLISLAGAVLLLGIESSLQSTVDAVEQTQAAGIARQLVDEVLGKRYMAQGVTPYQTALTANSWELQSAGRERYDDTDDFHRYSAQPVEDTWGIELGSGDWYGNQRAPGFQVPAGTFGDWREEVEVYYVDQADPSQRLPSSRTSNLRAVEVAIFRDAPQGGTRELVRIRRVYAYIPSPR
jgi:prepilin-type N-terminal cleavage/methylation domain-containing protein